MSKTKTASASSSTNNSAPEKQDVQSLFGEARKALNASLIERGEDIDLALSCLIAGEHLLLVGPPGCGKSHLLNALGSWMGSTPFTYLLTKFTVPDEVFGPIDIMGMKEGKTQRMTAGYAADAEFVFFDEIFKASSAILNTMLTFLNERKFRCGTQTVKCPLQICVGASNEWPEGKELGALFDRFLARKVVRPLSPAGRKELLRRAVAGDKCRAKFASKITSRQLDQARQEAAALPFSDAAKVALWKIIEELTAEGVTISDRRLYQCIGIVRASAYLDGEATVRPDHLEVLSHVLWDDPQEQPRKAAEVVGRHSNPTRAAVNNLLAQATEVVGKSDPTEAVPKLKSIQNELKALPALALRDQAIEHIGSEIKRLYNLVIGVEE